MLTNSNPNYLPEIQEDEFLPPINRWTRFGGLFIVAVVALAIPVASATKYKETIKTQALIRPEGELRLVQAATEGQVMQITAKGNQEVKKGDVIATLNDSRLQTEKSLLQNSIQQSRLQLVQINAQLNALNSQILAENNRINQNVAASTSDLARIEREYQDKQIISQAEVQETESDVKASVAALNAAKAKLKRYQSAAKEGAISQDQLQEVQLAVQQQQQTVAAAQAKSTRAQTALNPSDAEVAIATSRIAEAQATGEASLATLNKEKQALIQQKIEINQQLGKDARELKQVDTDLQQT
ncbi:MAG: biotin/lipoyl-binding protein, partial [Waterburya sp.]